jgi:uncharacterized protein (TIGR02246 family)
LNDAAAREPAELSRRFEEAWNGHDMDAFAALFEPDAIFVSRFGHVWRGLDEIVARHTDIHRTIYRDCRIANDIASQETLGGDVVLLIIRSRVAVGRYMPTGPREFSTVFSCLARRRDGWRIMAGVNVAVTDPETGAPVVEHPR